MIPFVDLKRQYAAIKGEIDAALRTVIESAQFSQGPELDAFEREFAAYCGLAHCVGVNTGADALVLAVDALGIGAGDEVILPANSFVAAAFAITANGATPVFADVDPGTLLLTTQTVEPLLTPRTKAVMPVHMFGALCDMEPLLALARDRGIALIEDAAQAHGARRNGRRAGAFGDLACFSFYPSKNLGAYGNGGAVVTDREDLAALIRRKRWLGQDRGERYVHRVEGPNTILDTLQAAVLRVKLRHLDAWNARRREHAREYRTLLAGADGVRVPNWNGGEDHVFHLFVTLCEHRAAIIDALRKAAIGYGIHYPLPLHRQPALAHHHPAARELPVTESTAARLLSLPMFPELEPGQIQETVRVLVGAGSSIFESASLLR